MANPDVLIIGGGVIGLTVARELTRRKHTVLVLTRDAPGAGASATAAGMLETYYPAPQPPALASLSAHSRSLYPAWARELHAETGYDIELNESGTLALAKNPEELAELSTQAAALPGSHLLTREADWLRLEPYLAPGLAGALELPDDHHVNPRRLCKALLLSLERLGVRVMRGITVTNYLVNGQRVEGVQTDAGAFRARWTVNAAGAWAGALASLALKLPVRPVKGQLLVMEAATIPARVLLSGRTYLVPRPRDGHILIGATVEEVGYDVRPTAEAIHDLLAEGFTLYPPLKDARFLEARVGLRPGTPDGLPILGPTPWDGLLLATGHFRKGILLAPATAALLGSIITGAELPLSLAPYSIDRFDHARVP